MAKTTKRVKPAKKTKAAKKTKTTKKTRATKKRAATRAAQKTGTTAKKRRVKKTPATPRPPAPAARPSPPPAAAPRSRGGLTRGAVAAAGTCLDLGTAGEIVQAAIPGGPHDIDSTLENAGLISPGERIVFREAVVRGVQDHDCAIAGGDVPNDATTTLRQARTAVRDKSGPR